MRSVAQRQHSTGDMQGGQPHHERDAERDADEHDSLRRGKDRRQPLPAQQEGLKVLQAHTRRVRVEWVVANDDAPDCRPRDLRWRNRNVGSTNCANSSAAGCALEQVVPDDNAPDRCPRSLRALYVRGSICKRHLLGSGNRFL